MNQTAVIPDWISATRLQELGQSLDGLSHPARLRFVRSLSGGTQAKLWSAAAQQGTTLADLVPPTVPPGVEVIHHGKNSLPLLSQFEKRFCRSADRPDLLYGYNEGIVRPAIGPGYFVAHEFEDRGEVGVDYHQVPPADATLPAGWPALRANESGLQRFVFAGMIDYLRRISAHVTVGRALRAGKLTNNYFLLCREDL